MAVDAYTQVHSLSILFLSIIFNSLARSGSNLIKLLLETSSLDVKTIKPKNFLVRYLYIHGAKS